MRTKFEQDNKYVNLLVFFRLQSSSEFSHQPILQSKGKIDKFKSLALVWCSHYLEQLILQSGLMIGIVYTFIGARTRYGDFVKSWRLISASESLMLIPRRVGLLREKRSLALCTLL
jgi:hypothetical protein